MVIYPIDPDLLEGCAALYAETFSAAPWNEPWTVDQAYARLAEVRQSSGGETVALAATDGGRIAGFVIGSVREWVAGPHFDLREMLVAPGPARPDAGVALVEALTAELVERGVETLHLPPGARTPAAAFYRKCGFYVSGRTVPVGRYLYPHEQAS